MARQTYAKLHRVTIALTEPNLRFLQRLSEFYGLSLSETARRVFSDAEQARRRQLVHEREMERGNA